MNVAGFTKFKCSVFLLVEGVEHVIEKVVATKIRAEREQEFKESMLGYRLKKDRTVNFLDYFQAYINNYTKKDIRMVQIALSRFKDFLKEQYPMNEFSIKPELITKEMMVRFWCPQL